MTAPLEPAHVDHLPFIRALIRDGAASGSFERELAADCPPASLFFANLRGALQSGYFVHYDPVRGFMQPVHASGYVYRPPRAEIPIGFGLFKEFTDSYFELWLLAISPLHRRGGHGRAMVRALLTTPVGKVAPLARCRRTGHGAEIVMRLLGEVGFVPRRTTAEQTCLVHERAPVDLVRVVEAHPWSVSPPTSAACSRRDYCGSARCAKVSARRMTTGAASPTRRPRPASVAPHSVPARLAAQGRKAMANEFTPTASSAGGSSAGSAAVEPRAVDAGRGASWWGEGWRLFKPRVGAWLLIVLILFCLLFILGLVGLIPILGQLLVLGFDIIAPVFVGGLMLGCRAVDRGNPLLVGHLFAGFSQRTGPLVILGLIYTGLVILISVIIGGMMIAIFGVAIIGMLTGAADPSQTGVAFGSVVVAVLLGFLFFLLLLLPLVMAIWFAPALVMLGGLAPGAALAASFRGCLRNIIPFLVYGVIGIVLAIIASIPLGLGWVVLAPVAIATIYASYCDIFEDKARA